MNASIGFPTLSIVVPACNEAEVLLEFHARLDRVMLALGETWELMVRTLSPKRLELLRHLHRNPARTIRALADALGRDYRRVHEDVEALEAAGLLERDKTGVRADYDAFDVHRKVAL